MKKYILNLLGVPLLLVSILFVFPNVIYGNSQESQQMEKKYVKLGVDGLACPFCAYGLEKKLKKVDGIDDLYIELNEGYATFSVPSDSDITEKDLQKIVSDAGFKTREVLFSDTPFEHDEK